MCNTTLESACNSAFNGTIHVTISFNTFCQINSEDSKVLDTGHKMSIISPPELRLEQRVYIKSRGKLGFSAMEIKRDA